ncbi:MAG: ClpXP protease specificity-enhancing factor SspB [Alphaproteobacteria bacterium]|nr:ClpXP protease specificity-enhancing factor SspB [Alphaproteobacteria bacterium]
MTQETIDYPGLIDSAMRNVVREALIHVDKFGLPGEHHFFISFQTNFPGVSISPQLKSRYPEEITIVVQHQFWDLKITDTQFSIMLSFNNIPEKLVVPFEALTAFADPSIKFGLQFHGKKFATQEHADEAMACPATGRTANEKPSMAAFEEDAPSEESAAANDEKVISLEAFRKR